MQRILIANRGEIACRIARTCRRLGLRPVAVHSTTDRHACHVREIGASVEIGGPAPADSYLRIEALIEAARAQDADAVHPGFGFLSENPDFARAVEAAGLIFIGPTPETLAALGDKGQAKALAAKAGVTVGGGTATASARPAEIAAAAEALGLPVMLKAVAGGGGRGMRRVLEAAELPAAIDAAMREAEGSFGRPDLIVEPYLAEARHIEVQIAGDGTGEVIHLFERECSLQRRHQKVVEEAPAPNLAPEVRESLLADACGLARALNYRGVGTVEFLVAGDRHAFLEVNPRPQVEHPATEEVTGLDIVELQLRIAAGHGLGLRQEDVEISGHAVEARLYAEDPAAGFLPAVGRLTHLRLPETVRLESGVDVGDEITPHYDAMIAKLIARGEDRPAALDRLAAALAATEIAGIDNNLEMLRDLLELPAVRRGTCHTGLIEARDWARPAPSFDLLAVAAALWLWQHRAAADTAPWATWGGFTGWRFDLGEQRTGNAPTLLLGYGDGEWAVFTGPIDGNGALPVTIDGRSGRIALHPVAEGRCQALLDGRSLTVDFSLRGGRLFLSSGDGRADFTARAPLTVENTVPVAEGSLASPMMGRILAVNVAVGQKVAAGAVVAVLESMKMEMPIQAPTAGMIAEIACQEGDMVERGAPVARIEPLAE